jgi:hypothetical protein
MPIYEYRLPSGRVIERVRSIGERDAPLPDHPGAQRVASRVYFRPESLYRENPQNGQRCVYNDYDDPWEGTCGESWAQESSKEFVAEKRELDVALGLADRQASFEKKRMIFA